MRQQQRILVLVLQGMEVCINSPCSETRDRNRSASTERRRTDPRFSSATATPMEGRVEREQNRLYRRRPSIKAWNQETEVVRCPRWPLGRRQDGSEGK
jgi:hypothetical protein